MNSGPWFSWSANQKVIKCNEVWQLNSFIIDVCFLLWNDWLHLHAWGWEMYFKQDWLVKHIDTKTSTDEKNRDTTTTSVSQHHFNITFAVSASFLSLFPPVWFSLSHFFCYNIWPLSFLSLAFFWVSELVSHSCQTVENVPFKSNIISSSSFFLHHLLSRESSLLF